MALTQLTAEQLDRLRSWWGNKDPYKPQYVSEEVWSESSSEEWGVGEFTDMLNRLLSKVPLPERATARLELEFDREYGGHLKLFFTREKTDEEKQVEIDRALAYLRENEERDAREFARLQAKFSKV